MVDVFFLFLEGFEPERDPRSLPECIFCWHHRSHHIYPAWLCYQTSKTCKVLDRKPNKTRRFFSFCCCADRRGERCNFWLWDFHPDPELVEDICLYECSSISSSLFLCKLKTLGFRNLILFSNYANFISFAVLVFNISV